MYMYRRYYVATMAMWPPRGIASTKNYGHQMDEKNNAGCCAASSASSNPGCSTHAHCLRGHTRSPQAQEASGPPRLSPAHTTRHHPCPPLPLGLASPCPIFPSFHCSTGTPDRRATPMASLPGPPPLPHPPPPACPATLFHPTHPTNRLPHLCPASGAWLPSTLPTMHPSTPIGTHRGIGLTSCTSAVRHTRYMHVQLTISSWFLCHPSHSGDAPRGTR